MTPDPLAPAVRRLFADLAHAGGFAGEAPAPSVAGTVTVHGEAGRPQRGTHVRFQLQFRGGQVMAVRYQTYGCPHTLAVCEWLSRELEAGRLATIGTPADWCQALDVPIVKLGRLLVVEDALRAALQHISGTDATVGENVVK